jgi:tetratricopeptide (TPR) repeat protein
VSNTENPLKAIASRVVIPSWKSPDQAIESPAPNLQTLQKRNALASKWFQQLKFGYDQSPSDHKAVELYESAILFGKVNELPPEITKIGQALLKYTARKEFSLWDIEQEIHPQDTVLTSEITLSNQINISRTGVKTYKKMLAENPNRPFCWSELARHYFFLQENDKAIHSMRIAMHLAQNNRYLCRAASRLFVQMEKYGEALKVLHSVPGFSSDPWLLSAEIAASSAASKTSKHIKSAERLLISQNFTTYQLSELAAAVGTIEMDNGASKKAKQLFNTSLRSPTANSLAQGQWAIEKDSSIIIPDNAWLNTPEPYEALALAARQNRDWSRVIIECAKWQADEPYSIGPAYIASYISFFPALHRVAEQFATYGLFLDPNNSTLLNNRAVARAYLGNLEGAWSDINQALDTLEGKESAQLHATLGLVAFRSGYIELGREYYRTSIAWFSKRRDKEALTSAMVHYLREETRIDESVIPQSIDITKKLLDVTPSAKSPELLGFCEVLLSEIADRENITGAALEKLNAPASSDQFQVQATLFEFPKKEETNLKQLIRNVRDLTKLL